jgi:hypothetical protein
MERNPRPEGIWEHARRPPVEKVRSEMRNKKKTMVASIFLAMALSLSACADDPDDGVDDTTDTGGVTTPTTIADFTSTTAIP